MKMKLNKKSQTVGRHVIILVIILLVVLLVLGIIIWQAKDVMNIYLNKIFS